MALTKARLLKHDFPVHGSNALRRPPPPRPRIWAKLGRFVNFPVLCLLAYGDTALKPLFLRAFGAHKKVSQ